MPTYKINNNWLKFPKWWTNKTKKIYKSKERLRKKKNKTHQQTNKYKELRKICKKEIKKNYEEYIANITQEFKTEGKKFWDFYNDKKKQIKTPTLTYNGIHLTNKQEIADTFAKHFFQAYNHTVQNKNDVELPITMNNEDQQKYFHINKITDLDILKEIKSMSSDKPPGPDGIPPILYRKCAQYLVQPLLYLFNSSLEEATFPDSLKESIIVPVPKKGCCTEINNHRPISNLNTLAKLYEGILYSKISTHIYNTISDQQHGFVSKKSTLSNLTEFCHEIGEHISTSQVDVIYTDVEKCFDRIFHTAIIDKLSNTGFSKPMTTLFKSYLQNRKNYVKYEECTSQPFSPPSGVVQGSKLSSLIFILTYNDIKNHIYYSRIKLYADDLKIYKIIQEKQHCNELQKDLDTITNWLTTIGLNFHPQKCFHMTYTTKKQKIKYIYKINNTNIEETNTYKDLGIQFQSNLSWDAHIENTSNKSYKILGMIIRHCQDINDIDAITMLFKSLVRSIIEYCSPLWAPTTKKDKKTLERVQARFLRYLFNKINGFYPKFPNYIEYKILTENLPIETIEDRFISSQFSLLTKILNFQLNSPYLLEHTKFRIPHRTTRPNPSILFEIPKNNTKSPLNAAMNLYNQVDEKPSLFL